MAMASAAQKVFNTPELLEAILEKLDMKTLLHSQRVDKTFKTTIDGSTRLKRILWFEATPQSKADHFTQTPNPWISERAQTLGVRFMVCPQDKYQSYRIVFSALPPTSSGSWRRMIPFQPAAEEQTCHAYLHESVLPAPYRGVHVAAFRGLLERADGLTMGEIVEALYERRGFELQVRPDAV